MMRPVFGVIVGLALAVAQTPVRDAGAAAAQATGTGALAGMIVTDDAAKQPIRRVVITLNAVDSGVAQTTISDDAGRFSFNALPAGRFSLMATKGAYVTTYYGGHRPGRAPAVPIPLAAGESRTNLVMKMARGGVITGRVTDASGGAAPISGVTVSEVRGAGADRTILSSPAQSRWSSFTDERGVYRIYGLPPGDFVVSVAPSFFGGGASDIRASMGSDVQRALLAIGQAGAGAPVASPAPATVPKPLVQTLNYTRVYFPGTTDFTTAGVVSLGAGEVRADVDFAVVLVRMSSVSGTVASGDGRALGTNTMVVLSTPGPSGGTNTGTQVNAAGGFAFRGLEPGIYSLAVRGTPKVESGAEAPPLWAAMDLTLDGNDLRDLALALQPGATVGGRVVFDGAATTLRPAMSQVRVNLDTLSMTRSFGFTPGPVQPEANGQFVFKGVGPGSYRLTATIQGAAAWTIRSSSMDGREAADAAVDVPLGATVANAVVTMTDRITELTGVFRDAAGAPTSDYTVLAFSTDRRMWQRGSRRIRGPIRPGADGRFTIRDLPAGEYFLAASTDLDAAEIYSVPVLDDLARSAIRVTLAEGEKKTQDLRLSGSR